MDRKLCEVCKRNVAGKGRKKCSTCSRGYSKASRRAWTVHKKDYCENKECTSTIVIPQQLEIDHKDGDRTNNDPSNLITLCGVCHTLKTYLSRDFVNRAYRDLVTPDSNG